MTIKKALDLEPDLRKLYEEDQQVRHLLDTARRLEGLARHASTHAAGLVVSDSPWRNTCPFIWANAANL